MPSARTCSHIKSNGVLCGSPALRHHTHCYFHHRWQKRQQQIARMGGPFGTNQQHGVELPILEGPESIMIAIMEIQHALLDNRITHKTATTLLYSIQLALQVKLPLNSLSHPFDTLTDLDEDSGTGAPFNPAVGLSGVVAVETGKLKPETSLALSSRPERSGVEGPASSLDHPDPCNPERSPSVSCEIEHPCHPERSTAVSCGAEGPFVSSPEAPAPNQQLASGITIKACSTPDRDTRISPLSLIAVPITNYKSQVTPAFKISRSNSFLFKDFAGTFRYVIEKQESRN